MLGLTAAFALSVAVYGFGQPGENHLAARYEVLLFVVSIPVWLLVAELYGSTGATRSARTTRPATSSSASSTS